MHLKKIIVFVAIFIIIFIFLYYDNNSITTTRLDLSIASLPKSFNGYKIVQLSDLHEKEFGKNSIKLVSKVKEQLPDMIFITGDLINATKNNDYNENLILSLLKELAEIAPVYYVTGNHEVSTPNFQLLEGKINSTGVNFLRNRSVKIEKNSDFILLIGIDDPEYAGSAFLDYNKKFIKKELDKTLQNNKEKSFKILLSHRPEQLELYSKYNIDLIFAGHAHGGQVRLPFIGGIYVPNQGFFPKYTSGSYSSDDSTMIVNRGLGNSKLTFRLFNRPEIVVATLRNK